MCADLCRFIFGSITAQLGELCIFKIIEPDPLWVAPIFPKRDYYE